MEPAIVCEFGVERRQQMPALTERDHRLGGPAVAGRRIREQGFGNARNDFDWGFVCYWEKFSDDLRGKK
jgi:hypothetical protein